MRFFLITVLYLSITSTLFAQKLSGVIYDAQTHKPLAGATILLPELQQGTITDKNGLFTLTVPQPGTYRLLIRFLGYQTKTLTVEITDSLFIEVFLEPTIIEASPVVVTARPTATDVLTLSQSIASLSERVLQQTPPFSALEAIETAPGVQLLRTSPLLAKPVIRGMTGQRVLILDNGVRLEGQQWGNEHAPELDPFTSKRIEILEGAASLLYGSDALGGVIQVLDDDLFAYDTTLYAEGHLQSGVNPYLLGGALRIGNRITRDLFIDVTSGYRKASSYITPDGTLPNTAFREQSTQLRIGYQRNTFRWLSSFRFFALKTGLFEPDEAPQSTPPSFQIRPPFQEVQHIRLKNEWQYSIGRYRLAVQGNWQENIRKEFEEGSHPALHLRLRTGEVNIQLHHPPIKKTFGTLGTSLLWQENKTLGPEFLIPNAHFINGSLFWTEEWIGNTLSANAGIRYDYRQLAVEPTPILNLFSTLKRTYAAWSGTAGLSWRITPNTSLALNIGRAWRAPTLIELFAHGVHEGTFRFEQGDPNLSPEKSLHTEVIFRKITAHLVLEMSTFAYYLPDYIYLNPTSARDPESGYFIYTYQQGKARLWGAELHVQWHPHPLDWLHLELAADGLQSKNLETGRPLPLTPPARIQGYIRIENPWDLPLRFNIHPVYYTPQHQVSPPETPSPGYLLVDLSSEFVLTNRLSLSAGVSNLFNTRYIPHLSVLKPYGIPGPGRTLFLRLKGTL